MLKDVLARKGEEERLKREGRLPPGQSLTNKFPTLFRLPCSCSYTFRELPIP